MSIKFISLLVIWSTCSILVVVRESNASVHVFGQLLIQAWVQCILLLQHQRHICQTVCLDSKSRQRKSAAHKAPDWISSVNFFEEIDILTFEFFIVSPYIKR